MDHLAQLKAKEVDIEQELKALGREFSRIRELAEFGDQKMPDACLARESKPKLISDIEEKEVELNEVRKRIDSLEDHRAKERPPYEYHVAKPSTPAYDVWLNELGSECWELVTINSIGEHIFKRVKQ